MNVTGKEYATALQEMTLAEYSAGILEIYDRHGVTQMRADVDSWIIVKKDGSSCTREELAALGEETDALSRRFFGEVAVPQAMIFNPSRDKSDSATMKKFYYTESIVSDASKAAFPEGFFKGEVKDSASDGGHCHGRIEGNPPATEQRLFSPEYMTKDWDESKSYDMNPKKDYFATLKSQDSSESDAEMAESRKLADKLLNDLTEIFGAEKAEHFLSGRMGRTDREAMVKETGIRHKAALHRKMLAGQVSTEEELAEYARVKDLYLQTLFHSQAQESLLMWDPHNRTRAIVEDN